MWQKISGFSDYLINEQGCIYRRSTKSVVENKPIVSLKADDGDWKNRSVSRLKFEAFELYSGGIIATSVSSSNVISFANITDAADWLIDTKQAITAGKIAAHGTVRTNISHGLMQPSLYPFMYGYIWKVKNERSVL